MLIEDQCVDIFHYKNKSYKPFFEDNTDDLQPII